jgi:hypothetical protein
MTVRGGSVAGIAETKKTAPKSGFLSKRQVTKGVNA